MKIAAVFAALTVAVIAGVGPPPPIDHGTRIDGQSGHAPHRRDGANIPGLNFMEQRDEDSHV